MIFIPAGRQVWYLPANTPSEVIENKLRSLADVGEIEVVEITRTI